MVHAIILGVHQYLFCIKGLQNKKLRTTVLDLHLKCQGSIFAVVWSASLLFLENSHTALLKGRTKQNKITNKNTNRDRLRHTVRKQTKIPSTTKKRFKEKKMQIFFLQKNIPAFFILHDPHLSLFFRPSLTLLFYELEISQKNYLRPFDHFKVSVKKKNKTLTKVLFTITKLFYHCDFIQRAVIHKKIVPCICLIL